MGTHRSKTAQSTSKWHVLAIFAEYSLIGTIWMLGIAVMIGSRSFSVIPYGLTLVITAAIAYAATRLRGTLRELALPEDQASGTGRKNPHAPSRHRTANA